MMRAEIRNIPINSFALQILVVLFLYIVLDFTILIDWYVQLFIRYKFSAYILLVYSYCLDVNRSLSTCAIDFNNLTCDRCVFMWCTVILY